MAERQVTGRPRRGERRLITRAQLLDAAERVFARDGLRGASVDAIALEAGYSTGAVYSNFKGKEDLFLTLMEERIDPRLAKRVRGDGGRARGRRRAARGGSPLRVHAPQANATRSCC